MESRHSLGFLPHSTQHIRVDIDQWRHSRPGEGQVPGRRAQSRGLLGERLRSACPRAGRSWGRLAPLADGAGLAGQFHLWTREGSKMAYDSVT